MAMYDDHATQLRAYLEEVCNRLDRRRRAPAFRQWQTAWLGLPLAAGLSLAATQCSGTSKGPTEECTGDTCAQLCGDGVDNDADGVVDCDDPDCSDVCVGTLYGVPMEENCSDGEDDDGDSDVDCADSDCAADAACSGGGGSGGNSAGPVYSAPLENCTNGADDDGDELVDCNDPDCVDAPGCMGADYAVPLYAAPMVENCDNGADEDGDNLIDCDDPDCDTSGLCLGLEYGMPMPEECSDGVDNDWDNATDCDDLDCASDAACIGPVPIYASPLYAAPIP